MRYRAEIDGLRAVSVISVILYHLGLAFPRAGLLGVDVFFVISGYLITNHIAEQLDRGCFSLSRFYERRARRILPALAVMLVLSLPFAYALMLPDDLENYGQSLVATALFANNVLLYLTSGYFELEAGFKPLLHTWSLGVEEQYYLAVPLMMMAAFALGRRRGAMVAIALVTVASFIACLWLSRADPKANFFLIFSRMWELGAGAAAGFVEPRLRALLSDGVQSLLATLGLGLVIASLAFIPAEALLPNGWTLVPVIGACLILALGSTRGAGGRLLSLRPIVFVGLISYSLYLYHQPVFAFTRIATLEEPSIWIRAALVAPIFGLAWLSWRFIERPYRDVRVTPRGLLLAMTLGSTGLCVALGLAIYGTSGFHAAWPELASGDSGFGARQNIGFNERPYRYRTVDISGVAGPSVLVLGNSFARDFINMAEETGRLRGYAVRYSESGECRFPMPDDLARQARAARFVVLGSGVFPGNVDCVNRRVAELKRLTEANLVVLSDKSFGWNNNALIHLDPARRYAYRARPLATDVDNADLGRRAIDPAIYVNIIELLSDADGRVPVFTPDRRFISQDRHHLTEAGARFVGDIVFQHPALKDFGAAPAPLR